MNVGHEMIFASAGSGKTHALTTRYIRLLAMGVAPERIAALTFTRRAAGEFFAEIVNRLAAASGGEAAKLALDVGRPEMHAADFLALLRTVVRSMHRLSLGTLDGYFLRVVRAFPLELGLGGVPGVMDEHEAAEQKRRVLGRMLAAGRRMTESQKALVDAFRQATFGTEGKAVAGRLDDFIERYYTLFRSAPDPSCWGGSGRIWPDGFPWVTGLDAAAIEAHAAVLRHWVSAAELGEKQRGRWETFIEAALAWSPGSPLPGEIDYVLGKALPVFAELKRGSVELKFDKVVQRLTPEAGPALAALAGRIVELELGRRLRATQGIGAVLEGFDQNYDAEVRKRGRLTFADLQQLLVPPASGRWFAETVDEGGEGRLGSIDYRLDGQLDHWMFDEFQDTSFHQWRILERLVDEVVQDQSGRRSLFYVGDIKQAIYTWREGDPQLFRYVTRRYGSAEGGGVVARELNESWRSGPEVIAMVNGVGGGASVIETLFPEAATLWNEHWRPHRTARPDRIGQAALLLADDEEGRWAVVRRLLAEIDPISRGLTCAVLVRTNETGARLADYLRREAGIAAVAAADLRIGTDNPVAAALAALLQVAAHPGDSFAARHVAMSPLGRLLAADALDGGTAGIAVLRAVQSEGFAPWIESWSRQLEGDLDVEDAFSRLRLRQLARAAQAFDSTGSRDVDAFLRFVATYAVREVEGAGVVQVMTVHKAKGLGFDVVLLPDLEGEKLAQRREGPAVHKGADRSVEWVLEYPGELIASSDSVLRGYLEEAEAENCYEQLSLLYVALTRAKFATYAIVRPPGKSTSLNFPRLLTATLGSEERTVSVGGAGLRGTWSDGSSGWFEKHVRGEAAREPVVEPQPTPAGFARKSRKARTPSAESSWPRDGGELFAAGAGSAAAFGSAVHDLLAEVEWLDQGDAAAVGKFAAAWKLRADVDPRAIESALRVLRATELAEVWRPRTRGEVWRERDFEIVLGDDWITGRFDRLIIERDTSERGVAAAVYEFKSDADTEGSVARHRSQLTLYARAAAVLSGVKLESVTAELVFLREPWRSGAMIG